jgi:hypothetical protein
MTVVAAPFETSAKFLKANSSKWSINTGTDIFGMSIIPGGARIETGEFSYFRTDGLYWTDFDYSLTYGSYVDFYDTSDEPFWSSWLKTWGMSARLVKDDNIDNGTMTDYDGNVYTTKLIGNNVWMTQNLLVTHYNDGTTIPNITNDVAWGSLTTGGMCYMNNNILNS